MINNQQIELVLVFWRRLVNASGFPILVKEHEFDIDVKVTTYPYTYYIRGSYRAFIPLLENHILFMGFIEVRPNQKKLKKMIHTAEYYHQKIDVLAKRKILTFSEEGKINFQRYFRIGSIDFNSPNVFPGEENQA